MSQIGSKGEKICSGQTILDRQTDGKMDIQMDGHTDHYWAPTEQGPN